MTKQDFIAAMGGAEQPVGSATVQDLADAIEQALLVLASPRDRRNIARRAAFWAAATRAVARSTSEGDHTNA